MGLTKGRKKQEILTRHKQLVCQYLTVNFDTFFQRYNTILIGSESYVTKRQSIKLLGEILLDRACYNVMMAYVARGDHLKIHMNLLKDDRLMIQYEAFHVFKVFVANPAKSHDVMVMLIRNADGLLKFLPRFLQKRTDDDQFMDEKSYLLKEIANLPAMPDFLKAQDDKARAADVATAAAATTAGPAGTMAGSSSSVKADVGVEVRVA